MLFNYPIRFQIESRFPKFFPISSIYNPKDYSNQFKMAPSKTPTATKSVKKEKKADKKAKDIPDMKLSLFTSTKS